MTPPPAEPAEQRHFGKFFVTLSERAATLAPIRVGVVHTCDAASLEGALIARDKG